MNADEQRVAIFVFQLDDLLFHTVDIHLGQAFVNADAVVDVDDIVAGLQVVNFFQGEGLTPFVAVADDETVVLVENLVVGVNAQFPVFIAKALVENERVGGKELFHSIFRLVLVVESLQHVGHKVAHAGALLLVFGEKNGAETVFQVVDPFAQQQIHIFAEGILRMDVEIDTFGVFVEKAGFDFHHGAAADVFEEEIAVDV